MYEIVNDFEKIKLDKSIKKPKVGIVGEILIKYHPYGNNYVVDLLEKEGAEVFVPELMGFVKYILKNATIRNKLLKTSKIQADIFNFAINFIDVVEKDYTKALANSKKGYLPPCDI